MARAGSPPGGATAARAAGGAREPRRGLALVSGRERTTGGPRVPRLALSPDEAARSLGVSRDYFDAHVAPELRIVRRGRRKLVPVRELEVWLDREAARVEP
jgi:hypothetical protein